jgi:hypothetical protein
MWGRSDNQDVGLEAAIIERVRNSSLVERPCAENVPGLKPGAETVGPSVKRGGRGAFHSAVKGTCEGSLERMEVRMSA